MHVRSAEDDLARQRVVLRQRRLSAAGECELPGQDRRRSREARHAGAALGTTGAGATNLIFSIISKDVLGLNVQIVRGYRGAAAVFLAQQRGEVDGQINGVSALKAGQRSLWEAGRLPPAGGVRRTTRLPELPDVPIARELTNDPKALALIAFAEAPFFMALPLAAPPDLPPDRAKALQAAFMDMSQGPGLRGRCEKVGST